MLLRSAMELYRARSRPWLARDQLRELQERKLRNVVTHAYERVPFYRMRFDEAGLSPRSIRGLDDLSRIPITTKAELQAAGEAATTRTDVPRESLVSERTSGSSGRPFTVRFDPQGIRVRRCLFLRALWTAGYRFGHRLLWIGDTRAKGLPAWSRWQRVAHDEPPEHLAERVRRFRPHLIYGWVTSLRQLARHLRDAGGLTHAPRAVVTTAEELDGATRRLLRSSLGAEVYDVYGLTEAGIIAGECEAHEGQHVAEDSALVELAGDGVGGEAAPLRITSLDMLATPILRFETGDLGVSGPDEPCRCGRSFRRLARIGGRSVDCLRLPDGRRISPFRMTLALEDVPGIDRYQVVQEEVGRVTLRLEGRRAGDVAVRDAARAAALRVLGDAVQVTVRQEPSLDPAPGRKFRVVVSRPSAMEHA